MESYCLPSLQVFASPLPSPSQVYSNRLTTIKLRDHYSNPLSFFFFITIITIAFIYSFYLLLTSHQIRRSAQRFQGLRLSRHPRPLSPCPLCRCLLQNGIYFFQFFVLFCFFSFYFLFFTEIFWQNQVAMKKKYRSFLHELAKTSYNASSARHV